MNRKNHNKLFLCIAGGVIFLLILLRFGLYFLKSGGFEGLSMMLPVLLFCFAIFAVLTTVFFAVWVYQDCKIRGDDPVVWVIIMFAASPFIGLLVYFLRRPRTKKSCPSCGRKISLEAKYCEACGAYVENMEDISIMEKKKTHHLGLIAAGVISIVLMLGSLGGFIVSAAAGDYVNTDVSSDTRVWNMGVITMETSTYFGGVWKLDFKSASDGYIEEQSMKIKDAVSQVLRADISCGTVPEDAELILWLVQGDTVKSVDVTDLSEPLEYPLDDFENGKLRVRLQINGVKDVSSEIEVQ